MIREKIIFNLEKIFDIIHQVKKHLTKSTGCTLETNKSTQSRVQAL